MAADLLKGWFCDRAPGRGKPVYSTGTTVVPTNGIVGVGVSSAGTPPTFANAASAAVRTPNLLDGWFCDRGPGRGKPVTADDGSTVPTNGPAVTSTSGPPPAPGPGGKYYFEITVVDASAVGTGNGLENTSQHIGFINAHQRDTLPSELTVFRNGTIHWDPASGAPIGGRDILQGTTVDGAVVMYANATGGDAWITGTVHLSPAIPSGRWNVGDVIGVAVDTINSRFWSRNWTQTNGLGMNGLGVWEGGGSPELATNGWDISALTDDLFIYFGAPGRPLDTVTLNAGLPATPFYGLDGTGVIPAGYVAWDQTNTTRWDASAAQNTLIRGLYRDPAGIIQAADALLSIDLPGIRTASISTNSQAISASFDNILGTTWSSAVAYPAGSVVMDGGGPSGGTVPAGFYYTPVNVGPSPNQPIGNAAWWSATIGVVSNTSKGRV